MPNRWKAQTVLFGLDETLSAELRSLLEAHQQTVYVRPFLTAPECLAVVDEVGADLVFCSSERGRYLALLEAVAEHKPDLPVVVVSRTPDTAEWLDSIEAGASDYCAAPFETSHIQWILDSVLKYNSSSRYRTAG
jgi:DNA-binding NtrC family response regulator